MVVVNTIYDNNEDGIPNDSLGATDGSFAPTAGFDVIYGGQDGQSGRTNVTSGTGADTSDGLGGDDTFFGFDGNDTYHGSDQNDTAYGGDGTDSLYGGN